MLSRYTLNSVSLVLLALTGASPVFAATCGEPSPLFTTLGDKYYDVNVLPEKPASVPELKPHQLIDALETFSLKSGRGEHTVCKESGGERSAVTIPVSIEDIEVTTHLGEVYINVFEIHPQEDDSHRETIAVSVEDRHVTVLNENELIEVKRQYHPTAAGSRFEEIRLAIRRVGSGISIRQQRYINGELAEWLDWTLSR